LSLFALVAYGIHHSIKYSLAAMQLIVVMYAAAVELSARGRSTPPTVFGECWWQFRVLVTLSAMTHYVSCSQPGSGDPHDDRLWFSGVMEGQTDW